MAASWALLLVAAAVLLCVRLADYRFDASLLSLLPVEQQQDIAHQRAAQANAHLTQLVDRELLVLVGAETEAQSAHWAGQVQARLASNERQVQAFEQGQAKALAEAYFPYRYFLLAPEDRARLASSPEQLVQAARRQLYSPMGAGFQAVDDPFWLFQRYLQSLAAQSPVQWVGGWPTLYGDTRVYRLLRFRIVGSAFDARAQGDLADQLDALHAELPAGVHLLSSGLVVHAAYGARMAKQEISTVGVGSLVGVLLLLGASLGVRSVLALLTCVGAGVLAAMAASVWWFESLHLITLAFGASLIGVAIDYGIHARMALNNGEPMGKLMPALVLGLVTSLLAYGIQGALPFPGLQQMALFSCVGLLGAWLSTCVWLPLLPKHKVQPRALLHWVLLFWRRCPPLALPRALVLGVLVGALLVFWQLPGDDRLTSLQTSPQALIKQEQTFQQLFERTGQGRFFLVVAQTEAALDEQLLGLSSALQNLVDAGVIGGFQSLHDWRPALGEQAANRAHYEKLLTEFGPAFYASLGAPSLFGEALAAFKDASAPLDLATWRATMAQPQWYFERDGHHFAIVALQQVNDVAPLAALHNAQVHYVDRPAMIGELLGHYRLQLQLWTAAAIVLVLGLLVWRLGVAALPLLAVPVVAVVLVAMGLAYGQSLTLFHCLALLLVLGIGFDSCIFLWRASDVAQVWQATSLSVVTSGISFGLLALSNTPVLHFFGVTVLCGLALVWLGIPCVYKGVRAMGEQH
ncbi:hypothetical protein L1F30_04075 [Simiduia sp. 21SJ11W-1]|uniref:MMPL family transporter n=1 Tax=Simiduia sp. 21SJ11W-1 TaxID=2909669 RepID=UPI0020A03870|nr:hypothetical protein [Simiduia sp. 21SJ11W-1]UTA48725.1 hypothetical protein L1F30_04075 [Simiduia sp. 21SJ11W-1]